MATRLTSGSVKTPVGDAPVVPIIMLSAGIYLMWFAIHYWKKRRQGGGVLWPTDPIKATLTGSQLQLAASTQTTQQATLTADISALQPDSGSTSSGGTPIATTGSAIADDALKYVGQGYVFGGPADKPGDWDCSSFVSYVLGHDLHQSLPGGGHWGDPGYPPHAHGPTSGQYALFGTGISVGQVRAGDLIANGEHVGIAISPTQMVSAQDPQLGVGVGSFPAGFPGGSPSYRRISNG
jgi:cell wall-associated NlpC family hydrolase